MTPADIIAATTCVFAYGYALHSVVRCWCRLAFFLFSNIVSRIA